MKNFQNLTVDTTHQGAIKTRLLQGLEENARDVAKNEKFKPFSGLGPTYAGVGASPARIIQLEVGGEGFDFLGSTTGW